MMKTLSTPSTNPATECPLSHPFTAHPKQCATCTGTHSPAADHIAAQHWLSGLLRFTLFALSARGNSSLDYLSHMATVMWKGTMPLAVTSLIVLVAGPMSATLFAATVLISSMMMARAHFLRVHSLGISQAWTLTWLLSLQITAWGAVAFLPFVQPLIYWS